MFALRGMDIFALEMCPFMQEALQWLVDREFLQEKMAAGAAEQDAKRDAAAEALRESTAVQD